MRTPWGRYGDAVVTPWGGVLQYLPQGVHPQQRTDGHQHALSPRHAVRPAPHLRARGVAAVLRAQRVAQRHRDGPERHNTARHGTAQHGTTRPGTARHNAARHNTARHNTARHNTARHNTAQHGPAQHGPAQHGPSRRGARRPTRPRPVSPLCRSPPPLCAAVAAARRGCGSLPAGTDGRRSAPRRPPPVPARHPHGVTRTALPARR